jgi:environmental stress-induced protein Ves
MSFVCDILKESDYETVLSEGGKTRRIAIEPKSAVVADRNFVWCFSNASIKRAAAAFSDFSGYSKQIMPIAGDLTLRQIAADGKMTDSKPILKQVYGFDDAEKAESIGTGEDFNLIYRHGVDAHIELYDIAANAKKTSVVRASNKFRFITFIYYVLNGSLSVVINKGDGFVLSRAEAAVVKTVNGAGDTSVALSSADGCEAVRVKLLY